MAVSALTTRRDYRLLDGRTFNQLVEQKVQDAFKKDPMSLNDSQRHLLTLAVYEVFSEFYNALTTKEFFVQIKQKATECISKPYRLGQLSNITLIKVCQKVNLIYDQVYSEVKPPEYGKEALKNLYLNFVEKNILFSICDRKEEVEEKYLDNIVVSRPIEKIQKDYQIHGLLQLRPINPRARTLIIGCGNGRFQDKGGYSFSNVGRLGISKENSEYSLEHNHGPEIVTIDPSLSANPTIVGFFGDQSISQIFKGQKFDRIIFEGFYHPGCQAFRRSDIETLLEKGGQVGLSDKETDCVPLEEKGLSL